MKHISCNCPSMRSATVRLAIPIRVMGQTEQRETWMCPECAAAWKDQTRADTPVAMKNGATNTPSICPPDITSLRKAIHRLQTECDRAAAARLALPAGSSRARVTTANARWMVATETRDRFAQRLYELTGEIA